MDRTLAPGLGSPGVAYRTPVDAPSLGRAFDATFLLKLLMRGKNLYLVSPHGPADADGEGENPAGEEARAIFAWLVDALSPLEPPEDELDPDYRRDVEEYRRKKDILGQAAALRSTYAQGLNLFGKPPGWVPRRSLEEYDDDMKELLGPLQAMETAFTKDLHDAEEADTIDRRLTDRLGDLRQVGARNEMEMQGLREQMGEAVDRIEEYTGRLTDIKEKIESILAQYELDLRRYVECDFSLEGLFGALEMMLFMGKPSAETAPMFGAMGVIEGGRLVTGLIDGMGKVGGVERSHIIQDIERLEGGIRPGLRTMLESRGDGTLVDRDSGATLLLADLDDFEREMARFQKAFPEHGARLRTATTGLKEAVRLRVDAIMTYNAIVGRAVQIQSQQSELTSQAAVIESGRYDVSDPTRAGAVSYIGALYQDLRNRAMELLYLTDRALAFWSAGKASPGGYGHYRKSVWGEGVPLTNVDAKTLEQARAQIATEVGKHQEAMSRKRMRAPHDKSGAVRSEIVVSVTDPGQLEAFRETGRLYFSTVRSADPARPDELAVPFLTDRYNIHVWYMRPRLVGVTSERAIKIDIVHLGFDRLDQKDGTTVDFVHDPVPTEFQYRPGAEPVDFAGGTDGSFYEVGDTNPGFAPPGLFARWNLHVHAVDNPTLDLSKLSRIDIELGILFELGSGHG